MKRTCTVLILFLLSCISPSAVAAEPMDAGDNASLATENDIPTPPGFESQEEVLAAIQSGQLKLIDTAIPVPEQVTLTADVEYGKGGDQSLRLDLYSPKHLKQPTPGLIIIHGGGWPHGLLQAEVMHRRSRKLILKFLEEHLPLPMNFQP